MSEANHPIIQAWDTILFERFCRFRHLLVEGLAQHSDAAFDRVSYPQNARVLDVGCGFGDSTLHIARSVGPGGEAVGVDCSANFIRSAEELARREGVNNARFLIADAQGDDLGAGYDHAFARFGTMFFSMPAAAMRNLRAALKPNGSLTQVVWRKREENPWLHAAELRVKEIVPIVPREESGQLTCGPGPFSMADADVVSAMLRTAGFERIAFERHDCDICIGRDIEDAVEFAMALGPAGEIMRLAGEEGVRRRPQVIAALRQAFAQFERPDGIWAPSSTWLVTANNPR